MTFGEKLAELRARKGMTQTQLANTSGVAFRTIQNWEGGARTPRSVDQAKKVADALGVEVTSLLNDSDTFVVKAGEEFGYRGKKGAKKLLDEVSGLFSGGEMAEEDIDEFMLGIQQAYIIAKRNNRKYTPKQYRDHQTKE